jgi:O-antigen/teichoic acid export membrane protein
MLPRAVSDADEPAPVRETPRRTVGAGATVATASQVVTVVSLGLISVIIARTLGPEGTGSFNVILSTLVLLAVPFTLGIELGIAYRVAGGRLPPGEALRQSQLAAVVLGLLAAGVGVAVWAIGRGTALERIALGTLAIGLASLPFLISWTYSGNVALAVDRYEAYGMTPGGEAAAALVLIAVLAPLMGLEGAVLGLALSHVLAAAAIFAWLSRAVERPPPGWLRRAGAQLRPAATFGIKGSINNALQQLNYRADLFILNAVAARSTVGHYAVALTLTTGALVLPRALSSVLLPRISSLDATADARVQERMAVKSVRHSVVVALGTVSALAAGLPLVPLVYGSDFDASVGLGYLLLPGLFSLSVGTVMAAVTVGKGRADYALAAGLIITPITLVLYALLVPRFEATGAAVASSISYTLAALVWWMFWRRATGVWSPRALVPSADELADYRALARRLRARVERLRARPSTSR